MNPTPYPASAPRETAPAEKRAKPLRSRYNLRDMIAKWRDRDRFRAELERKLRDDPHLIDDIGMTRRQVEEELARPFWQVL
jgi:uncharacterized protein YjiS (DUF1127 family)